MSKLYVVTTPIGNLEDITLRALRVLNEVSIIAAEDTRVTRRLLSRYNISTPTTSFHDHNARSKLAILLKRLEEDDIAIVCDAGTPAINDPGQELVSAAVENGVEVAVIPGTSALTAAIAVSGIPMKSFVHLGFLPRASRKRKQLLESIASEQRGIVAFETPHRLQASLHDLLAHLGDRQVSVCRELTKLHEEVFRGRVSEAATHFDKPRGEFTLVIEGLRTSEKPDVAVDPRPLLEEFHRHGTSTRDAVAMASEATGLGRRELYAIWLEVSESRK